MNEKKYLEKLFGPETVKMASQIDIADLQINEDMTRSIATGVNELKKNRGNPGVQSTYIKTLDPGSKLLLCMWLSDMELLDKIR